MKTISTFYSFICVRIALPSITPLLVILMASTQIGCGEIGDLSNPEKTVMLSSTSKPKTTVTNVSSSTADGSYKAGQVIAVTIAFSNIVSVSGTPRIVLSVTPTTRYATYFSGSGTSTITFHYTVQAGDSSSDLDYASASALELNSGTIQDINGIAPMLTLSVPGVPYSLSHNKNIEIDTTAPSAPSSLALSTPTSSPGYIQTPIITIGGVTSGDTVKLFTDNTCTTQVGSATSSATSVNVTSSTLADATYTFYASATDAAGNASTCSTASVTYLLERAFTFVGGTQQAKRLSASPVYGTLGVANASNNPGARSRSITWTDSAGNLWLFGGNASDGMKNDLWKYDITTQMWTWISGSQTTNSSGTFGVLGTPSTSNIPSVRGGNTVSGGASQFTSYGKAAASWVDSSGNLWLFGGSGYDSAGSWGTLGDLWRFNPTTLAWTWMGGSATKDNAGTYGVKGTPSTSNVPSARDSSASWVDGSGLFWLFGGVAPNGTALNDLWRYNPTNGEWTWMKGSNTSGAATTRTTLGNGDATTTPGARFSAGSAYDNNGNLWVFGGNGISFFQQYNDLWRYNINDNVWIWVAGKDLWLDGTAPASYGTKGVTSAANTPGVRSSGELEYDGNGYLWLFGGLGSAASSFGNLGDVWKFRIATGEWTWVGGANSPADFGLYGSLGVPSTSYSPGSRADYLTWTSGGKLWVYGGSTGSLVGNSVSFGGYASDLWSLDYSNLAWTWVAGYERDFGLSIFGTLGASASTNTPNAVSNTQMISDSSGNLWLFGGYSIDSNMDYGYRNSLWKYQPSLNEWTWVAGAQTAETSAGVYGVKGTPSTGNIPSGRYGHGMWTDTSGNMWIFGGMGFTTAITSSGYLNDLWKYNPLTQEWTWIAGVNTTMPIGTYGTLGTPSTSNIPGGRTGFTQWKDASGSFWIFGGSGRDSAGTYGSLNDLWKFNPTTSEWTWVSGANTANALGTYGTKGTPSTSNIPGARSTSMAVVDASGNLWLFGGYGFASAGGAGRLNDLWKFNPTTSEWTWISGANTTNEAGVYGTLYTAAALNVPGARSGANMWINSSGKMFLMGGFGYDSVASQGYINDLWSFNTTTGNWTWIKGSDTAYASPVFGVQGTPDVANIPGGGQPASAKTPDGAVWFFAGNGVGLSGLYGGLDQLWVYQ